MTHPLTRYKASGVSYRSFPSVSAVMPPVAAGLIGWWDFWGDSDISRKNLAWGKGQTLVETGEVVFSDTHASFHSNVDYFTSDVPETTDLTWIVIWKPVGTSFSAGDDQPMVMDTFGSDLIATEIAGNRGARMWASNAAGAAPDARCRFNVDFNSSGSVATVGAQLDIVNWVGNFKFTMGRYSTADQEVVLRNYTDEQEHVQAAVLPRLRNTHRMIRLGSKWGGSTNGLGDVMTAVAYNRDVSDAQMETLYAGCRKRAEVLFSEMI